MRTLRLLPMPQAPWDAYRGMIRLDGLELRIGDEFTMGDNQGALRTGLLAREASRRRCDSRRGWMGPPEVRLRRRDGAIARGRTSMP